MTAPTSANFNPRKIFAFVLAYYALQTVLRLFTSGCAEYDEAEQLIMSQQLHWGYGVQPPLYTWLQTGFFKVFGVNLFALALLKNLLLCGTCFFVYRSTKAMTESEPTALAALASLFLLPQIAWESQRDQTHSVLATMLAAATLLIFVRLTQSPRPHLYALLGLCAGLGCLSKYNYTVFIVTLLLAVFSLKMFRPTLLKKQFLLTLATFALVTLPHGFWMWTHQAAVLARMNEVHFENPSLLTADLAGMKSLLNAVLGFSGPALLVYAVIFYRSKPAGEEYPDIRNYRRLLGRILIIGLLLCLGMVLTCQARFKDRWMQPLLFVTPIFLAVWFHQRLDTLRLKLLIGFAGIIAAVVFIALLATPYWALAAGHLRYLNPSYTMLTAEIKKQGFTSGAIARDTHKIGGNLRLHFPDSPSIGADDPEFSASPNVPWLVIWTDLENPKPYQALTNFVWKLRGVEIAKMKPVVVETPYERSPKIAARFNFIILEPATNTPPAKVN